MERFLAGITHASRRTLQEPRLAAAFGAAALVLALLKARAEDRARAESDRAR